MTEIRDIAEDMDKMTGSELKAIIAIYSEGGYVNSTDMMHITGMSRKTCLRVMESEYVRAAIERVKNYQTETLKSAINELRVQLIRMEDIDAK